MTYLQFLVCVVLFYYASMVVYFIQIAKLYKLLRYYNNFYEKFGFKPEIGKVKIVQKADYKAFFKYHIFLYKRKYLELNNDVITSFGDKTRRMEIFTTMLSGLILILIIVGHYYLKIK